MAGGALALRRRRPLVAVTAITAALSLVVARNYVGGPVFVTELVALYSLAVSTNRRRALVVAGIATLVLVGTGAAEHVIERHPDQAREALAVIRTASGDVLDELAAVLGLLRVDAGEDQPRSPTPSLEQLDGLLESTRRAGIEVDVKGGLATSGTGCESMPMGVPTVTPMAPMGAWNS